MGMELVVDAVAHGAKRTLLPWRRLPPLLLLLAKTGCAKEDMVFNLVRDLCVLLCLCQGLEVGEASDYLGNCRSL